MLNLKLAFYFAIWSIAMYIPGIYGTKSSCEIQLVESIPEHMKYPEKVSNSTFAAWKWLLREARKSVNIASFYWTLRGRDVFNHSTANLGEEIFEDIWKVSLNEKISVRITQNMPTDMNENIETELLEQNTHAKVVKLNFTELLGGGVLHTKLWIIDQKHFYIGSANMDWRALTQVKELGIFAKNCQHLAEDVNKIFEAYWFLGTRNNSKIPDNWPTEFETVYNVSSPMKVLFNKQYVMDTYFSSSPPPFLASGRTSDLLAILSTIETANKFIYIAVMDYAPLIMYSKREYWPFIDTALRIAAISRNVKIRMLISLWQHSNPIIPFHLQSLLDLSSAADGVDIDIRYFVVPANADESSIPFGRVNHNKYMVTDNTAYIGTSNWEGDYFTNTAGAALVMKELNQSDNNPRVNLCNIFLRDWDSEYSLPFKAGNMKQWFCIYIISIALIIYFLLIYVHFIQIKSTKNTLLKYNYFENKN